MDSTKWFYLLKGQQRGPMSTRNLQELLESKAIPSVTLVWTASQPDWQPANYTTVFSQRNLKGNSYKRKTMTAFLLIACLGIRGQYIHHPFNPVPEPVSPYIGKTVYDAPKKMTTLVLPIRNTIKTRANPKRTVEKHQASLATYSKVKTDSPPPELNKGNDRAINRKGASEIIEPQKENKRPPLQRANLKKRPNQKRHHANKSKSAVLKGPTTKKKRDFAISMRTSKSSNHTLSGQQSISSSSKRTERPNLLLGHVSNVDHKFKRIVITVGSKRGISVGEKFRIISRRDGDPLGQLSIQQVLPSMSIAIFEGKDFNSLKLGDQILR